ncbi:hypothetical protein A2960_02925 [Candidatus Gottesmanbacteria bacterium RIFCSPLOWO2_01_FULL_39_12b]|uniref:PIN domain-containing protein n=1 Tax=Candidatus Gottesmanbacteria bacterium RIFCSPLOWO2_01_FULL_39_12b TaxID=1798388 RepID=A0A1F6AQV2_9BACT|nr:MAG: hypothetical protein A2960_02925 [Candidatus Gottesmanbacteria bacterium RIFCSPLOWO2_01_FULL_39_12b]
MKKCYLDSNLLVYLKNESSPHHVKSATIISTLVKKETSIFISPLTIDEYLHSFQREMRYYKHTNIFPTLKSTLDDILHIPLLTIINIPADYNDQLKIVELMEKFSLHSRDAYHLQIMLKNTIDFFATFDTDFKKVFAAKILRNP